MNQYQLELQRDLYRLLLGIGAFEKHNQGDINTILSKALGFVVKLTNARIGYIELRNEAGEKWWSTWHCLEVEVEAIQKRISTGIIAEALATGDTIVTPSAFLDSRFQVRDSVREERIEAVLCSPFERDGIVGVIYLQGDGESELENPNSLMETELFAKHITPLLSHLHHQVEFKKTGDDLLKKYNLVNIIGKSPLLMSRLLEAMTIAELDVSVLITGETGTGKGVLARAIHNNSSRKNRPFVHLNCTNLPEQLAESELFGAVRGAHSSAYTEIKGKIAAAKGGTLFLDEIGELPLPVQAKLLQFLEEGSYYPLGSAVPVEADVRIISATNINFEEAISKGRFRADLYYRLCVFPIEMPSLQQRKEDIPLLVRFFMDKHCQALKIPLIESDPSLPSILQNCEWCGNVRQLENKILQGILRARAQQSENLQAYHLLLSTNQDAGSSHESILNETASYRECKETWEREFLNTNLDKHIWNISETAKSLGMSRSHLNALIKEHNLERKPI
jgi:Nif-specific regulatory protein